MKSRLLAVLLASTVAPLAAVLGVGCANQLSDTLLQHLDRPVDIAFGCIVPITDDQGLTELKGIPTSECGSGGNVIPGGGNAANVDGGAVGGAITLGLVLEGVRGDVSIANLSLQGQFVDSDPFALGLNGLPVGRLPIGIVTSSDGCYATVANSGTCDLATIDMGKGFRASADAVKHIDIRTASGLLGARPAAITAPPSMQVNALPIDAQTCSSTTGTVYVAFPGCHLVARIDVASGMVLDGVQFHDGAPPEIVGPDVTCPSECGGGDTPDSTPDAGAVAADGGVGGTLVEPSAVTIEPDGTRLYIGGSNSPTVYIVGLDTDFKATNVQTVTLEGAGGIRRISASGRVNMSQTGTLTFRFLYIVGADNAVHVVDVRQNIATPVECDTQIDRRFLHGVSGDVQLACFPVGTSGFPRRADARGPGLRLPDTVVPLDVGFFTASVNSNVTGATSTPTGPNPGIMSGTFAVISALGPVVDPTFGRGLAYFVTIKDQIYPDSEAGPLGNPTTRDIAFAIPHTLRDSNANRFNNNAPPCLAPAISSLTGATRILSAPTRTLTYFYNDNIVNVDPDAGVAYAPSLHRATCSDDAGTIQGSDWELSMGAPPPVRASLFPDLEKSGVQTSVSGIAANEQIIVSWEGPLTATVEDSHKSGARVGIDTGGFTIDTPGALLCNLGVQIGDVIDLIGCTTDQDCGIGEICVNHPDAPSTVTGMCLPRARRAELLSTCAPLLTTLRKYTVIEAADDHTIVVPRPATLFASPIDGCTDAMQCSEIEDIFLTSDDLVKHQYRCESDPASGGVPQCVVACTTDLDCDVGSLCDVDSQRCILGPILPVVVPDCLQPLQNYEYHAGQAFTIVSSQHEYGSRQKVDPQTGLCVPDETKSPLVIQRFHRLEAPCTDLSVSATSPNPCSLTLKEPATLPTGGIVLRDSYGIRVRSVGLTFDVTDVALPLGPMPGVRFSPIFDDYSMVLIITAGFAPLSANLFAPLPDRIRIAPDSSLYIVDSGDDSANFSTGQVVPLLSDGSLSPFLLK